jgi:hypothetical protein
MKKLMFEKSKLDSAADTKIDHNRQPYACSALYI